MRTLKPEKRPCDQPGRGGDAIKLDVGGPALRTYNQSLQLLLKRLSRDGSKRIPFCLEAKFNLINRFVSSGFRQSKSPFERGGLVSHATKINMPSKSGNGCRTLEEIKIHFWNYFTRMVAI